MSTYEYIGNLHVHTPYSDGEGSHAEVAEAARRAGLDFLFFTDHNLWLDGIDGYYGDDDQGYILIAAGEEVHDRTRNPQCNHLLVYNARCEVAEHAHDLATLIQTINQAGGLSFIAHPDDYAVEWIGEPAIPWLDRHVDGFTGLEIWNYMSRFKDLIPTRQRGIRNVFRPEEVMIEPNPRTLALWDQMLELGHRIVGIGSADAHGTRVHYGPLTHTVFPYDFLFSCVNTHLLTHTPLRGEAASDLALLYDALAQGRAYIGYDIPGDTRGFRYSAQGQNSSSEMGGSIRLGHGVTLQILAPARAHIKVIRYGKVVAEDHHTDTITHVVREPGAYRAEVWLPYHGVERAWIFSNPIYVEPNPSALRG